MAVVHNYCTDPAIRGRGVLDALTWIWTQSTGTELEAGVFAAKAGGGQWETSAVVSAGYDPIVDIEMPDVPAGPLDLTVSLWLRRASTSVSAIAVELVPLSGAGAVIVSAPVPNVSTLPEGTGEGYAWRTVTLPAATGPCRLRVRTTGGHAYITGCIVTEAPPPVTYFDGATPNTADTSYAWLGAADVSASTATTATATVVTIDDPGPQLSTVGELVDLMLTGSTTDPSGELVWDVTGLPPGLAADGPHITGTPTSEGVVETSITATDPTGESATLLVTWTVEPVDDPGDPDPPDPDPDPTDPLVERGEVAVELAAVVAAHIDRDDDPTRTVVAAQLPMLIEMVHAYTRGRGFTGYRMTPQLQAVVVSAACRVFANPDQLAYSVGDVNVRDGFRDWSMAERFVLDGYRKRFA